VIRESRRPGIPADLVGIDVGGTKTHIRAVASGEVILDHIVPSASWRSTSIFPTEASMTTLGRLIAGLVELAPGTRIAAGIHGCDTPFHLDVATVVLSRELGIPVLVVNDAELLGYAAGAAASIQIIAGTGAIVLGHTATGAVVTADGYSWILGDIGSAAALVREGLRGVLDAHDAGTDEGDPLMPALLDAFSAVDASSLAMAATEIAGASTWGAHAPLVFRAADAGSAIATRVISAASQRLADGVASVLRRGAVAETIIAAGGVIVGQPRMQDAVVERLRALGITLPFAILDQPPVVGAVRLASTGRASVRVP
jgi:N-acetylglucosamine kinase-like BadF-type ATPase